LLLLRTRLFCVFLCSSSRRHDLHSFPTRRSSDLAHRHILAVDAGRREHPIFICLAHPLLAVGLSSRLKNNPAARPARPAPAIASQLRFTFAQSCGLVALARPSNSPCAPPSPGTSSHSLAGRSGST